MEWNLVIIFVFIIICLGISIFSYWRSQALKKNLEKQNKKLERRMYELAILKELGDRIGYSLNVQNIIDIITGSLHQFLEYNAVSYMLIEPEKLVFKVHLEESVSRKFIDEIKDRMTKSLSALMNKDFSKSKVEEILSGAILVEEMQEPVRSFFNIPLVIGEKVVGVLTVAHTRAGLYQEEETTILYKITQQASNAVTRLQSVIRTEQKKLNAMVTSMTEGVIMTDKDYRILVANPAAKKAVGIENKKDVDIFDFIDNLEGKFDIRGKLEESVKLNKVIVSEETLIANKYYQIIIAPVSSDPQAEEKEILGGVVIFHDITHDKELEKMREDFTSMMVHELRSPLDGIKKIANYMSKKKTYQKNKELSEYMQLINNSSSNMLALVNDLLDVAKLDAGKFEIDYISSNIATTIKERLNFYKPLAQEKNITLTSVAGKNLPDNIKFDPIRISQVLNNLVSNAIKYTNDHGEVTIQSFLHEPGNNIMQEALGADIKWMVKKDDAEFSGLPKSIIVAVTDNGTGIDSNNISGLFNKFIQFQSSLQRDNVQGTGLGLAIAKGIVEAHNGKIHVASESGQGTTFYFSIPVSNKKN